MRLPPVRPRAYLRVTLAAQFLLGFIIVSGAAVRLTGSGLGCTDWPTCSDGSVVAPLEYHPMIEFGNRLVTGAVSVIVILAVLGSLGRVPRRRDLVWLSLGLVAGVLGQIVLGGLTVLFHLAPPLVMSHFLLSMVLLWCAVVLHHRAGLPDDADARVVPLTAPSVALLGRAVAVTAAVVIVMGTIVTGTGPHPGAHEGELIDRLPFSLHDVARLHGTVVVAFCGLVLLTLVRLVRTGAAPSVVRRAEVLLAVLVAQAAVGYTQYFAGVPALLVGVHVLGSVLVWVASLRFALGMRGVSVADAVDAPVALAAP